MATALATGSGLGAQAPSRPLAPLMRRALRDARVRMISFAYLFAAVAYVQPLGYRHTYPTLADRLSFAHSFADNKAVLLFYGKAYDLLTVGGYSAWRVGGTLAIFAAVFGLLAPVRALRAEEEAGRAELVLAQAVSRRLAFVASIAATGIGVLLLWVATLAGLIAGGLPAAGSAYLSLSVVSVAAVFVGIGAIISQLAPSNRIALELGGAAVGLSFIMRVLADTASGAGWLRWLTPLGWAEDLRPFTGSRPLVLLAPLAVGVLLLWSAARITLQRDIGRGVLAVRDRAAPRLALLSSPTMQALRGERTSLAIWLAAVGALGFVVGVVSKSVSSLGISKQLGHALAKLGAGSALTPRAYIGFSFSFFVLAVSVLGVSQLAAARHEEGEQRLETILTLPVSRQRWLVGRLALGCAAVVVTSMFAAALTWAGAVGQGVTISAPQMLETGFNCLPIAILFLGVAALAYAAVPRAASPIAYGLLVAMYLWNLFGSLLGAPHWLVQMTPFAHVNLVPAQPVDWSGAAAMFGAVVLAGLAAVAIFARRDLAGA